MLTFPAKIVYAKNPAHEQFMRSFDGKLLGRYHIAFLVVIEFAGGPELRRSIEDALGHPTYLPNEWFSARDLIVMFDLAIRAGVAAERIGTLVMPTFKRANPKVFEGTTIRDGFERFDQGYRDDTTYGGVSPGTLVEPTRAVVHRKGSPLPCDYFAGVVKGLLGVFSIQGTCREVECQWTGARACRFEATWEG